MLNAKNFFITFILTLLVVGAVNGQTDICGDVNNTGKVDIVDALVIAQKYVGLNPPVFNEAVADVNADGVINIVDGLVVAQYYVGLIPSLSCKQVTPVPTTPPPVTGKGPRLWATTDYGPGTDKDDQVVMSVLLLWANLFRLEGIIPGSHKRNYDGYGLWKNQHGPAYEKDYPGLSKCFDGYPTPEYIWSITMEASTSDGKGYRAVNSLDSVPTVKKMIEAARRGSKEDPLYVLLWGPQGEGATAVDWLLRNEPETLDKMVFIAHASVPSSKYNCKSDKTACSKLHSWASQGKIKYIECGDSGQMGIHKNCNNGSVNDAITKKSALGSLLYRKWPDWSDGASFVCLLPEFGVDYSKLKTDGSNNTGYLTPIFCQNRDKMYDLIEERCLAAVGTCK